ncbi:MAG: GNAT family N-acetyltransferase [Planctomycetota bacterium]|jgi:GNAT superfamily N-acetyltransferase
MLEIVDADGGKNLEQIRVLLGEFGGVLKEYFCEYCGRPDFKEYFENYEHEIAHLLPGSYARPNGCLLLAECQGKAAGCVGLKDLGQGICEMRRLFVRDQYRGLGIGRTLAQAGIDRGRRIGYSSMRLNTNPKMVEAHGLYMSLGFKEIPPYEHFSVEDLVFMELKL